MSLVVLSPSVAHPWRQRVLGPALFQPGDKVHVKGQQREKALWTVVRRDYWHTDTEPAYELRYGSGPSLHIRYAFQSDLEQAEAVEAARDLDSFWNEQAGLTA